MDREDFALFLAIFALFWNVLLYILVHLREIATAFELVH